MSDDVSVLSGVERAVKENSKLFKIMYLFKMCVVDLNFHCICMFHLVWGPKEHDFFLGGVCIQSQFVPSNHRVLLCSSISISARLFAEKYRAV